MLGSKRWACLLGVGDGVRDLQSLVGMAEVGEQPGDEVAADEGIGMVGSERWVCLLGETRRHVLRRPARHGAGPVRQHLANCNTWWRIPLVNANYSATMSNRS
jgi:hypothetical protein